jgi:hypothetical protein
MRPMTFDAKAWMWFLSSYAPLWVMLGLRFQPLGLRIGLIVFGIGCAAYVAYLLTRGGPERPSNATLTIAGDAGAEVSGYLAAYLLPFLTVADPDSIDLITYAIFVVVAGLIYVRSGLMQINPTVYLLNRKVMRATTPVKGTTKEVFVISRRDLRVAETLKAERFSDRVYIDHGAGH